MRKKFNEKRLLITAYFWRFGIIALAFLLPVILESIFFNIESLKPYTPFAVMLSTAVPPTLFEWGIDYFNLL